MFNVYFIYYNMFIKFIIFIIIYELILIINYDSSLSFFVGTNIFFILLNDLSAKTLFK